VKFGRHADHGEPVDQDLDVDVHLEQDITAVQQAADAYVVDPSEPQRQELLAALGSLDQQTAASDAYAAGIVDSGVFGFTSKGTVLGETGPNPVAEVVPAPVLRAQIELVQAAKSAVTTPGPSGCDALRAASSALAALWPPTEVGG